MIAATFGFGSQTTFASERTAYNKFPQLVIALKNQLKRFRKLGIAPIAAAGQFGNPLADYQWHHHRWSRQRAGNHHGHPRRQ